MSKKTRVDILLVERGLVESRSLAQRLVMAGQVRADGQVVNKPANKVDRGVKLTIDHGPRFVSRGGEKLQAAFDAFALDVDGKICADVGASTGGFTDCLLQHGAARVYAIDVGKGILYWKLRKDLRVVVMEETNARFVENLPEPVSFVTIDASFISLKILLPVVKEWLPSPHPLRPLSSPSGSGDGVGGVVRGEIVALIKPQFEAGRRDAARGKGVIRDPEVHRRVLTDILAYAEEQGFSVTGLIQSPIEGPKGNIEFLARLRYPVVLGMDWQEQIDFLIPEAEE
jgi:23S rRNA (cytidine1920-2'-O)/16S rRNA (cytidine1409-2'-O)-methyltransferase